MMRCRAMFPRPRVNWLKKLRNARNAFGAAVLAAGLFLVILTPGQSQACGRDADVGATATTQVVAQPTVMPDEAATEAMPQAVAASTAPTSKVIPMRESGGCCGGASHPDGATCLGASCSWCSATLLPMMFDLNLDARACIQVSLKRTMLAFTKSDSVFHPPRFLVRALLERARLTSLAVDPAL